MVAVVKGTSYTFTPGGNTSGSSVDGEYEYDIIFGDNESSGTFSTSTTHVYAESGSYTMTVNATDTVNNATGSLSVAVTAYDTIDELIPTTGWVVKEVTQDTPEALTPLVVVMQDREDDDSVYVLMQKEDNKISLFHTNTSTGDVTTIVQDQTSFGGTLDAAIMMDNDNILMLSSDGTDTSYSVIDVAGNDVAYEVSFLENKTPVYVNYPNNGSLHEIFRLTSDLYGYVTYDPDPSGENIKYINLYIPSTNTWSSFRVYDTSNTVYNIYNLAYKIYPYNYTSGEGDDTPFIEIITEDGSELIRVSDGDVTNLKEVDTPMDYGYYTDDYIMIINEHERLMIRPFEWEFLSPAACIFDTRQEFSIEDQDETGDGLVVTWTDGNPAPPELRSLKLTANRIIPPSAAGPNNVGYASLPVITYPDNECLFRVFRDAEDSVLITRASLTGADMRIDEVDAVCVALGFTANGTMVVVGTCSSSAATTFKIAYSDESIFRQ